MDGKRLTCTSMRGGPCGSAVGMIDREGFIYCGPCGLQRRGSGVPCRPLTGRELRTIQAGGVIAWERQRAAQVRALVGVDGFDSAGPAGRVCIVLRPVPNGDRLYLELDPISAREWGYAIARRAEAIIEAETPETPETLARLYQAVTR